MTLFKRNVLRSVLVVLFILSCGNYATGSTTPESDTTSTTTKITPTTTPLPTTTSGTQTANVSTTSTVTSTATVSTTSTITSTAAATPTASVSTIANGTSTAVGTPTAAGTSRAPGTTNGTTGSGMTSSQTSPQAVESNTSTTTSGTQTSSSAAKAPNSSSTDAPVSGSSPPTVAETSSLVTPSGPCSTVHCGDGGNCSMIANGTALCMCAQGFTGKNCSTASSNNSTAEETTASTTANTSTDEVTTAFTTANTSTDEVTTASTTANTSTDEVTAASTTANTSTDEVTTASTTANTSTDEVTMASTTANNSTDEVTAASTSANSSTDEVTTASTTANNSTDEVTAASTTANRSTDEVTTAPTAANTSTSEVTTAPTAAKETSAAATTTPITTPIVLAYNTTPFDATNQTAIGSPRATATATGSPTSNEASTTNGTSTLTRTPKAPGTPTATGKPTTTEISTTNVTSIANTTTPATGTSIATRTSIATATSAATAVPAATGLSITKGTLIANGTPAATGISAATETTFSTGRHTAVGAFTVTGTSTGTGTTNKTTGSGITSPKSSSQGSVDTSTKVAVIPTSASPTNAPNSSSTDAPASESSPPTVAAASSVASLTTQEPPSTQDPCSPSPCKNGGTCNTSNDSKAVCSCAPGYTGTNCSTDINDCSPNPCKNSGNCTDGLNAYNCTCVARYQGTDCSENIDECASEPCQNNGTCNEGINKYTCNCTAGFNGTQCEHNIDDCVKDNCKNGGTCQDGINDYTCECADGWKGDKNCSINVNECKEHKDVCHKNANCTDTEGSYNCTCKLGFVGDGKTCNDIDECSNTSLCKNDADCFNTPGSYRCTCIKGWTGYDCSGDIDECSSKPCDSYADCTNTNGSYTCTCQPGYRGDGHTKCIQEVLIPTNGTFERGDDNVIGPVSVQNGVYYYGKLYRTLYVSMNGYITLGQSLSKKYPPSDSWAKFNFPIIAPLWADIETTAVGSGVSVQVISDNATLEVIQKALNQTQAVSQSILVTWKQAVPYPVTQKGNQRADFQAVISTVGTQTLIMFNYDQEQFSWTKTVDKNVVVGLSNIKFDGDIKFDSNDFTEVNKHSSSGHPNGRWVFNVTADTEKWIGKVACENAVRKMQTTVPSSQDTIEPCPCDERQVKLDRRFKHDISVITTQSYITRFSNDAGIIQRCNYASSGYLLRGYPNGGYLDIKSSSQIKDAHDTCCSSTNSSCFMFYDHNPSDTCARYVSPSWSSSWGGLHITTLDGLNYAFNGRGEYTLFKTNKTHNITVQVRTDLFMQNNTDATVIVGVAIKVDNGTRVEVLLDRRYQTVNVYTNGIRNSTFPGSSINIELKDLELFNDNNKMFFVAKSGMVIQIGVRDTLDIVVAAPPKAPYSNSRGLLGNHNGNLSDDLIPANATSAINSSSSERDIFYKFGQTWRITPEESLFTYNMTNVTQSYVYYNNETIVPSVFIADISKMEANLTAYLQAKCGSSINVSSCNENLACLVDTAASCDIKVGQASKESQENATKEKKELDHKPPVFNSSDHVYIGYSANTTLELTFSLPNATLDVSTSVTSYIFTNESFVWNMTDTLRNTTMNLTFVAIDNMKASSEYSPSIYYCGCEKEEQCDFSFLSMDGPVIGKFYRARCNCSEFTEGDFCETKVDQCYTQPCFTNVTCNSSDTGNICGKCPEGYVGDGYKCYDKDECYTNTSGCQQGCVNTLGPYNCNCTNGYYLNSDQHTCTDVDECLNETICGDLKYCSNTNGSYECLCKPGLASAANGTCYKNKISFAGVLVFEVKENNKSEIKNKVYELLMNIFQPSSVIEIVSIYKEPTNRRRKRASDNNFQKWKADYIVHEDKSDAGGATTTEVMKNKFDEYFNQFSQDNGIVVPEDWNANINLNKSKLYSDADGGICKFPGKVECDEISTDCTSSNGTVRCSCKSGFATWENPYTSCKDVDECQGDVCKSGTCENTPGSFICTCPAGYSYNGKDECVDLCQSNPCQNGGTCVHGDKENQYLCKCNDMWSGTNCEEKNSEAEKLKIIAIAVGASVGAICFILLFVMCGMYRRHKHKYSRYSSRPLSGLDFDTDYDLQPAARTKDFPIDDSENTTFSIPRPQVTQNVYESSASSSMGKLEEPKKPLTDKTEKENDKGHDNQSFLHSEYAEEIKRDSKRTSKNPYEYF